MYHCLKKHISEIMENSRKKKSSYSARKRRILEIDSCDEMMPTCEKIHEINSIHSNSFNLKSVQEPPLNFNNVVPSTSEVCGSGLTIPQSQSTNEQPNMSFYPRCSIPIPEHEFCLHEDLPSFVIDTGIFQISTEHPESDNSTQTSSEAEFEESDEANVL